MYKIYADGGCDIHSSKKGGWGVAVYKNDELINSAFGGSKETTNNQMELEAFNKVLDYIQNKNLADVEVYLDSSYVIGIFNGMEYKKESKKERLQYGKSWIGNWIKNDWKKKGDSIKNLEQIQQIHKKFCFVLEDKECLVKINHCKAHSGIEGNEMADQFATMGKRRKKNFAGEVDEQKFLFYI